MPGRLPHLLAPAVFVALAACTDTDSVTPNTRLLAVGDSVLAWNGFRDEAIPDVVGRLTGLSVANLSVAGARVSATSPAVVAKGGDIRQQYRSGPWEWVILNGGANDLLAECGCNGCGATLDSLVGPNGQGGDIPALVDRIVADSASIVILGYYNANVRPNPFSRCSEEVDELNRRLEALARRTPGAVYVGAEEVIDPANPAHWFVDRVHPSPLGSERIGAQIAAAMRAAGG